MDIEKILGEIDFEKMEGLVPLITQDYEKGDVLMLGFADRECLKKTLKEGKVTYWSRTRKKPWTKGETSGNYQVVKEIWLDCDSDSVLIKVEQAGNVCHTGNKTCFFKKLL